MSHVFGKEVDHSPILALNEPAVVTGSSGVLEAETWVGKKLPILEHIDIGQKLSRGRRLILFYHHDYADCIKGLTQIRANGPRSGRQGRITRVRFIFLSWLLLRVRRNIVETWPKSLLSLRSEYLCNVYTKLPDSGIRHIDAGR
ncbi:MAG: hypothetical protein ACYS8Z_21980 [Planctomycetota bacterium]|jgi:hypothetical protein